MENLLKRLVEAPSISGSEKNVRDLIAKEIKPYVDEIKIDKIGNLICRKGKGSPKIMIAAHMDELGFMVKQIDDKGFIKFETIGGWDTRIIPARKVKIYGSKGSVAGVIGSKAAHLQEKEEKEKPAKLKEMYIDVGASSRKDVDKLGISVGDFIIAHETMEKLYGTKYTGHNFDDKIGCLAMIEIAKALKKTKGTIYFVGSVKEEIGLVGIRGSSFHVNPDIVIALDVGLAGDTPDIKGEATTSLGEGPVLVVKDALSIIKEDTKKWVMDVAKKNKIPIQMDVTSSGATDAAVVPMIREGIPSVAILSSSRYTHTPVEVVDMKDVKNMIKLIIELVKSAHRYL